MPYDAHGALSPRSLSVSTTSPAYAASIPARVMSPHLQKSLAVLQGGPPDLRVGVPHAHDVTGQWGAPHHMAAAQQYHHHAGASQNHGQSQSQGGRAASWDMTSYLESTSAATAGGSSTTAAAQPLQYPTTGRGVADLAGARRLSVQQVSSQAMPRP